MNEFGILHATTELEAAGLSASLRHVSGWPVLSITGSPQTLELELVNRMPWPVTAGPARLQLIFRPGILSALENITLAPQSMAAWALTIQQSGANDAGSDVIFELTGLETFTLAPGEATALRLDGVSAAAEGGSRGTRVQLKYGNFFLESGAEAAGSRLMHLSVLRRHEPASVPATELRTGSTAVSGPFLAGFLNGPDVLNDGKTSNPLTLRIVNNAGRPILLSDNSDEATRFYLTFQTGVDNAEWGLLGTRFDHLDLAVAEQGWQVDNHTIRRVVPGVWERGAYLDLELTIYSQARTGDAQIILTYENLPGYDDGDLVLLAHLGKVAATEDSVTIAAPVNVRGGAEITGLIRSGTNHLEIAPATFKLGGSLDSFYPVVFEDLGWAAGEFRFEVFRPNTHVDGEWRGSMMGKIICHSDRFGHGSGYWTIEVRQSTASPNPTRHFIGGFVNYPYSPLHVLWLAGDTTYSWLANHPARISAPSDLTQPGAVTLGAATTAIVYPVKSTPDSRFNAAYISISESLDRDTGAVPRGSILLWSGSASEIPLGWALCDGSNGTPDLPPYSSFRFITSSIDSQNRVTFVCAERSSALVHHSHRHDANSPGSISNLQKSVRTTAVFGVCEWPLPSAATVLYCRLRSGG